MATFNEIYNNYLRGVQSIAPISGQQGITSLATPIAPNINATDTSPTSTTTSAPTSAPTTMNAPFTSSYSMTLMDAVMAAMNPIGGLATMAAKNYGYPSLGYALGAMTGLGPGGAGGGYGASNTSGAVDTGDLGSEAANDAATAAAAASVGAASSGSEGSEGGTDSAGDGGDGYAMGGRVSYLQGGLVSLLGNYYGKR